MKEGDSVSFYQLVSKIGAGGFGDVWMVKSSEDSKYYAMKMEPVDSKRRQLQFESSILKKLQNSDRFPKYLLDGVEDKHYFLVEELLGPNISTIADNMPRMFFAKEYLFKLADELLSCIEQFHLRGYLHRDIKPQNFVVRFNADDKISPICLIDYGLSRLYIDNDGNHLEARQHVAVAGSPLFASPNNHLKIELSRRDDLYSWLYSVLAVSEVGLPWSTKDSIETIGELKKSNPISMMIAQLGGDFVDIAKHVEGLGFADTPNYRMMHETLRKNASLTELPFEWMTVEVQKRHQDVQKFSNDPTGFLISLSPYMDMIEKDGSCFLI
jgi:casein kinase 1